MTTTRQRARKRARRALPVAPPSLEERDLSTMETLEETLEEREEEREEAEPELAGEASRSLAWLNPRLPDAKRWGALLRRSRSGEYLRDALTGEKVPRAALGSLPVYRVPDETLYIRPYRDAAPFSPEAEVQAYSAPAALHNRTPDGRLGGKRYSSPFGRRLAHALPRERAEELRLQHEWWDDPYVVGRLQIHMTTERFAVVMARLALGWSMERLEQGGTFQLSVAGHPLTVRIRPHHDRAWLSRCEEDARRIVKSRYLPDPYADPRKHTRKTDKTDKKDTQAQSA